MLSLTRPFWASAGSGAATIGKVDRAAARVRDDSLDMFTGILRKGNSGRIAVPVPSYPLRQFDCYPAKPPDRRTQQGVGDRFLGAMFAGRRAVLQLLGLEVGNIGRKLRVVIAKFSQLLRIMAIDLRLDRVGAGHRRLFADQRGRCAQGEA